MTAPASTTRSTTCVDPAPAEPARADSGPADAPSRRHPGRLLAWAWLTVIGIGAAFGSRLPIAEGSDPSKALDAPITQRPDLFSAHPLGTDRQGLDLLAQSLAGARISLAVAGGAVGLAIVFGGALGLLAGYRAGRWDVAIRALTDSLLAYPPLVLLLAIVTAFNPSIPTLAGALGLLVLPTYVRLVRAVTLRLVNEDFVQAAVVAGARPLRIALREITPAAAVPVVAYSFVVGATLVVAEASLSFLGVGIQRPTPTWGNMIAAGQADLARIPHLVLVPGTVLFLTVFAMNHLGEAARSLLDPREAKL